MITSPYKTIAPRNQTNQTMPYLFVDDGTPEARDDPSSYVWLETDEEALRHAVRAAAARASTRTRAGSVGEPGSPKARRAIRAFLRLPFGA